MSAYYLQISLVCGFVGLATLAYGLRACLWVLLSLGYRQSVKPPHPEVVRDFDIRVKDAQRSVDRAKLFHWVAHLVILVSLFSAVSANDWPWVCVFFAEQMAMFGVSYIAIFSRQMRDLGERNRSSGDLPRKSN